MGKSIVRVFNFKNADQVKDLQEYVGGQKHIPENRNLYEGFWSMCNNEYKSGKKCVIIKMQEDSSDSLSFR